MAKPKRVNERLEELRKRINVDRRLKDEVQKLSAVLEETNKNGIENQGLMLPYSGAKPICDVAWAE